MKWLALILAGSMTVALARAQEHQIEVFVDGKKVEAVVQPDGTIRVPSLALTNATPVAPTPPLAAPATPIIASAPVAAPVFVAPAIRGSLAYYRDIWHRDAPDAGGQVWLVREQQTAAVIAAFAGTEEQPIPPKATGWESRLTDEFQCPRAVANRQGEFSFENVPPGRYLLIYKSVASRWTSPRDRTGKVRFQRVEVTEGQAAPASMNFGRTAATRER
jgi:hypothetical protein